MGVAMVPGYVRRRCCVRCRDVVQAGQEVCPSSSGTTNLLSVRVWAAPEAEKRLDESGLEWRYKPSPNSGYPNGIPK